MERRRAGMERLIMMKRMWLRGIRCALGLAAAAAILAPQAAQAQITRVGSSSDSRQAIGLNLGYFALRGLDSRVDDDVLFNDLDSLAFDIKEFNGLSVGAEWVVGLGDFIEAGVGANYYQRTVPSVYRDLVNTNGAEIEQDLKLRIVPLSATVRFLPIGRRGVTPYVGAGIGVFNWRYSETGEFVDSNSDIFRDTFEASGTALGPVILGGVRVPVGDIWTIGGEVRYQKAEGDTSSEDGLLGSKIDLGGWTTSFTMHIRF
jgi:opacity protein-like surface antigen